MGIEQEGKLYQRHKDFKNFQKLWLLVLIN